MSTKEVISGLIQKISEDSDLSDKVLARRPSDGDLLIHMNGQACKYIGNGMIKTLAGGVLNISLNRIEAITVGFLQAPVGDKEYEGIVDTHPMPSAKPLDLKLFGRTK